MANIPVTEHSYRYRPVGGVFTAWTALSAKPFVIPNVNIAIGDLQIYTPGTAERLASEILSNASAINALAAPTIASFAPTSGAVGSAVTITGTGFTGATNVRFAGLFASFTVLSDTEINATVPVSATTGKITVETPHGDVTSANNFTVTVSNQPPIANASSDRIITLPVDSVFLTGTGTDPDGFVASYLWTKISGTSATIPSPNTASTSVTGLTEGVYVFRLSVIDNEGTSSFDEVTVTVNPASAAPPTFVNFSDTEQGGSLTLIPTVGIPMSDYRYTLPGSATVLTPRSDGFIVVGDVAGVITAWSVTAGNRPQSEYATSPAFTRFAFSAATITGENYTGTTINLIYS